MCFSRRIVVFKFTPSPEFLIGEFLSHIPVRIDGIYNMVLSKITRTGGVSILVF